MSTTIQYILLDLGHVLINADENLMFTKIQEKYDVPTKILSNAINTYVYDDFARGQMTSSEYFEYVSQELKPHISDLSEFTYEYLKLVKDSHILEYNPEVLDLVNLLITKGYKVVIVTDTDEWQSESFRRSIDFDKFAYKAFESHLYGYLKSDPGCFQYILNDLKIEGNQVLLIDDKSSNNVAAQKEGITAPGFESAKQIKDKLIELNII